VSSSPWNLDDFITEFLARHAFPAGPLLLRDLLGRHLAVRSHTRHKVSRIEEILDLHPDLRFVLVGDSGQHDPAIYAQIAERHPGRIIAAYIREVRLDPADGRVETVAEGWPADVPFELFADSAQVARHAHGLGLVSNDAVDQVERSVQEHTDDNDGGDPL
jgi:phosphatidate phosphatase APP1